MKAGTGARDMRLDALRGLFLIIMTGIHVPTPVSHALQDPFSYNGSAEGFIFLSACLAGLVYGKGYIRTGWNAMAHRAWNRSKQIYYMHLAVALPIVLAAWALARHIPPLANHFPDFLVCPWTSLGLLFLLLYQPPLLDILPIYVIFLGATPLLLAYARRRGWGLILALSAIGWLAVQLKLDSQLIGDPHRLLPIRWGAFNILAWQFLWIYGLALGETSLRRPLIKPGYRFYVALIPFVIVLVGLLSRHGFWPQSWWNNDLFLWMDKWKLGPLRLLNFFAWVLLLMAWNPHPPKWLLAPTALLGRHSLPVFAFHLPLAIGATTAIQMLNPSNAMQTVIGFAVIAALFPWAAWLEHRQRRRRKTQAVAGANGSGGCLIVS